MKTNYTWREKLEIIKTSFDMIGFWMTIRYSLIHLLSYLAGKDTRFDRKYGTDTTGIISAREMAIDDEDAKSNAIFYLPAPESVTRHILGSLEINHADFSFIDFGSGKGRVLLVASTFPFRKIIGVEISEQLHEAANRNIEVCKASAQRCSNFELQCINALDYELPDGDAVLHFYHPFLPEVLRPVLRNIGASLEKLPRKIFLLYLYHVDYVAAVFDEMPFLRRVREVKCVNTQYNWALYENVPADAPRQSAQPANSAT